ncbi:MAG: NifU family protein [Bacteroidetes bacterium]|nr:MAG: NifU family protein [Bacteroidota bacterium]
MLIYTEVTPNPQSIKFVVPAETPLLDRGTWEATQPSPTDPPLLQALWAIPGVKALFLTRAFLTVTKSEEAPWHTLIPQVKEVLRQHLPNGPLANPHASSQPTTSEGLEKQIQAILEEYVRPGIAMDGGDVEFVGYAEGVVRLRLQGSCSGCPSSLYTLKAGIEALLTRLIPEVHTVEAVE